MMVVRKIRSTAQLMFALCAASCSSYNSCSAEWAKQRAAIVAKDQLNADEFNKNEVFYREFSDRYQFEFFQDEFIGGGVVVIIEKNSCKVIGVTHTQ